MKRIVLAILIALLCIAPVLGAGKSPGKVGAYLFLARTHAPDAESLRALVNEAADAGIQFLMPYARTTEGNALYDSKIIPQIPRPYDALEVVIEAAHARGMEVHPWFVVTADGYNEFSPILQQHPDWCMVDINGKRVGWIDPSSPEARQHVVSVLKEIAANYDIDGINLDYLRYATPGRYCFCERCTSAFTERFRLDAKAANNAEPGSRDWAKWRLFRYRQTNQFMRELRVALREVKPEATMSAYVWGAQTYGKGYNICQDWKTWMDEGHLDWVNPMGYYDVPREYLAAARWNREMSGDLPMHVTLTRYFRRDPEKSLETAKTQIRDAMKLGADGIVLFHVEGFRPMLKDLSPLLHDVASGKLDRKL